MNQRRLALILSCIVSLTATAHPQNFSLSIMPVFSVHLGHMGEHLYTKSSAVENPQTSYLQWEVLPLCTAGLDANINLFGAELGVRFSLGFPKSNIGSMYDSDWFSNTFTKQSFSVSKEILTEAYYTDATLGYSFALPKGASIKPFAGFSYHFINISAPAGGSGTQDPNRTDSNVIAYDSPEAESFTTAQIDYWRESIFVWIGGSLCTKLTPTLKLSLTLALSPFSSVLSSDYHYNNGGNYFNDKPFGFFCAAYSDVRARLILNEHIGLELGIKVTVLSTVYGKTYTAKTAGYLGKEESNSYAGASQHDASVSFGVAFTF